MFREDVEWPAGARVGVGIALLLTLLLTVLAPNPTIHAGTRLVLGLTLLVLFALVWMFTTLYIRIDATQLVLSFGVFQTRVERTRIVSCAPVRYRWQEWGGFGLRIRPGARLYNVLGDGGKAVQVVLDDGQRLLFSSQDPDAVCRALETRPSLYEDGEM